MVKELDLAQSIPSTFNYLGVRLQGVNNDISAMTFKFYFNDNFNSKKIISTLVHAAGFYVTKACTIQPDMLRGSHCDPEL